VGGSLRGRHEAEGQGLDHDRRRDAAPGERPPGRAVRRGDGPAPVAGNRLPSPGPPGEGHERAEGQLEGTPVDRRAAPEALRAAAGDAARRVRDHGHPEPGRVRDGAGDLPVGGSPAHGGAGPVHPVHHGAAGHAGVDEGGRRGRGPVRVDGAVARGGRLAGGGVLGLSRDPAAPGIHREPAGAAAGGAGLPAGDDRHRPREGVPVGARDQRLHPAGDHDPAGPAEEADRQADGRAVLQDPARGPDPVPARLQGARRLQPGREGRGRRVPVHPRGGGHHPGVGGAGLPPGAARRPGHPGMAAPGPVAEPDVRGGRGEGRVPADPGLAGPGLRLPRGRSPDHPALRRRDPGASLPRRRDQGLRERREPLRGRPERPVAHPGQPRRRPLGVLPGAGRRVVAPAGVGARPDDRHPVQLRGRPLRPPPGHGRERAPRQGEGPVAAAGPLGPGHGHRPARAQNGRPARRRARRAAAARPGPPGPGRNRAPVAGRDHGHGRRRGRRGRGGAGAGPAGPGRRGRRRGDLRRPRGRPLLTAFLDGQEWAR
jgi:hypothetical protein